PPFGGFALSSDRSGVVQVVVHTCRIMTQRESRDGVGEVDEKGRGFSPLIHQRQALEQRQLFRQGEIRMRARKSNAPRNNRGASSNGSEGERSSDQTSLRRRLMNPAPARPTRPVAMSAMLAGSGVISVGGDPVSQFGLLPSGPLVP